VQSRPTALVLTGIVTTHDVVVAPQIGGRLVRLGVKEGDSVTRGQEVREIEPGELAADRAYYEHSAEGLASQVQESEAALRFQERQLGDQITQADATIATTVAQLAGASADAERAKVTRVARASWRRAGSPLPSSRTRRERPTRPRRRASNRWRGKPTPCGRRARARTQSRCRCAEARSR
jgi:multidrug efflux pump subunit AcrA (membrane-fusion protein)